MKYYTSKSVFPIRKHCLVFKNCRLLAHYYWLTSGTLAVKSINTHKILSMKCYDSPKVYEMADSLWQYYPRQGPVFDVIFDVGLHDVPWSFCIWWSAPIKPTAFATMTIKKTPTKVLTTYNGNHSSEVWRKQTTKTLSRPKWNTSPEEQTIAYHLYRASWTTGLRSTNTQDCLGLLITFYTYKM